MQIGTMNFSLGTASRWLVIAGFFASFVLYCFLICRMPVFSHIDETAHVDYVLKIERGKPLPPNAVAEPDIIERYNSGLPLVNKQYLEPSMRFAPCVTFGSAELMQPSFTYRVAAIITSAVERLGGDLTAKVVTLRIFCALLVLAAHVLVFLGIFTVNRQAAVLALAYLVGFPPVDLLRFSNDSMAAFAGAGVFWALMLYHRNLNWRYVGVAGAFLALTVLSKLTALVFVGTAAGVTLLAFAGIRDKGALLKSAAILFLPAAVCAAFICSANHTFSGSVTGMSEAAATTQPEGWTLLRRTGSIAVWQWWHETWLTIETMLRGQRGSSVYPVHVLVTGAVLGEALALGAVAFAKDRINPMQRNAAISGLLAVLAVQIVGILILSNVGKIWLAGRMIVPVEGWVLVAVCSGYTFAVSQIETIRIRNVISTAIWVTCFSVGIIAAREYLRLRAHL